LALFLGPAVFVAVILLPMPPGMEATAWRTVALAAWMAIWWSTEAVPVPITALLPVIALPLLGIGGMEAATAPYAHPLIFLFLGGFLLALGIQRHNLHRRIALGIILRIGTRPAALVAGFMAASGLISMWVSNTATAMMMMPIAISVIGEVEGNDPVRADGRRDDFAVALLLAVAYGASIGGLGTLIGTPPNALLAAFAQETYGVRIGFAEWMVIGVPMALVMGICAWLVLTRWAFHPRQQARTLSRSAIADHIEDLGPMSVAEKRVAAVFLCAAAGWLVRPLLGDVPVLEQLTDPAIAIAAGAALFILPSGLDRRAPLLIWRDAAQLPWGTLILFGGGLSLAGAISSSGLAEWIGGALATFASWPSWLLTMLVALVVVFLTELTSNTATTAAFLPVMGVLAGIVGVDPLILMAPAALAASAAFMLPVATPPNAIVHGSGLVAIPDMVRAGFWLNIASVVLISLLVPPLLGLVFGS
jgi:sodium-dependent dicarboxylate transporter 2/3/5